MFGARRQKHGPLMGRDHDAVDLAEVGTIMRVREHKHVYAEVVREGYARSGSLVANTFNRIVAAVAVHWHDVPPLRYLTACLSLA